MEILVLLEVLLDLEQLKLVFVLDMTTFPDKLSMTFIGINYFHKILHLSCQCLTMLSVHLHFKTIP